MKKLLIALTIFLSFTSYSMELSECEKILLGGLNINDLIKEESAKEASSSEYIKLLNKVKNCDDLVDMAILKENGMVRNRNPVSAKILETFVDFHHSWIMPEYPDYIKSCQDKYQWDVYDKKAPSYHLTRALFQQDRKVQVALTGYGDLRTVRAGENPKVSLTTGLTSDQYKSFLATTDQFQLNSDKEIVGFLYRRNLSSKNLDSPNGPKSLIDKENWPVESLNIYKHFGGGLLGSPSFLYHFGQKKEFYRANGRQLLPRKYASAIWNNLLCKEPNTSKAAHSQEASASWNHPITQESNCLSCHGPLDKMAAGFRHITFVPTGQKCSDTSAQIHIPFSFKASATRDTWSNPAENKNDPFHLSYPVSYHQGKRLVGLAQLGKAIADNIDFYKCQVSKYHHFLYGENANQDYVDSLAQEYKLHQNGLKLLKAIMATRSKQQ